MMMHHTELPQSVCDVAVVVAVADADVVADETCSLDVEQG